MRLVCPNCGAQYEVDDRVMPEEGRDVQCSNCGHAWFFTPPKPATTQAEAVQEPKIEIPAPHAPDVDEAPEPAPTPDPEPTPDEAPSADPEVSEDVAEVEKAEADSADAPEEPEVEEAEAKGQPEDAETEPEVEADQPDDSDDKDDADTSTPAAAAAPRTEVREEVKQILQEEAEQELRAREAESQGIETQPDLGLDAAPRDNDAELAARLKQMEDEANAAQEEVDETDLRSRDMLPDIEEINSTLDTPDSAGDTRIDLGPRGDDAASSGSGFRRGFSLTILLAVLLVSLYVLAPQISERFPQAQGALDQYTTMGDGVRLWLEGAMQSAIEKMRALMDTSSEG
ncbi:zinc-ribbon domain-containing protein [uncultured Aliiroseovarius sp.]|uniref:zinc-ribbon domain-containing protein n=1 Tax=uncultured Aliiroseovarius sp. TaxID=1658783 RepID=UPI0026016078|nr:zinc-ribbon domain-containing protein [uncultured Aliiroseovarius sp.]